MAAPPLSSSLLRVAIYEEEPSSLVAYTLSSPEYFDFLRDRRLEIQQVRVCLCLCACLSVWWRGLLHLLLELRML